MNDEKKILPWLANSSEKEKISMVDLEKIETNPYQPRRVVEEETINDLAHSIKNYGLIQPIILRKIDKERYQIVVGERRLLACRKLGWEKISAVVKDLSDNATATIALIENLQRENLNIVEEAEGYYRLMEEFGFTQEVLAQRLGKSQSGIANKIRLLKLPDKVKQMLSSGEITERHARGLLKLFSEEEQEKIADEIVNKNLNVKQTEKRIEESIKNGKTKGKGKQSKTIVRDLRIYLNTIRQAVNIIQRSGINPTVVENDEDDYYEISIKLPKK